MEMMLYYLNFPFVRYALIIGVIVSACTALVGTQLVIKKQAFFGSSLSNIAFALYAIAIGFSFADQFIVTLIGTLILSVICFKWLEKDKHHADAKLAMVSVSALSIGYLMVNFKSTSGNAAVDVCQSLFGSVAILTLSKMDFIVMGLVSIIVIVVYYYMYHRFLSVALDADFMKASGASIDKVQWVMMVLISVIIVLGMQLVGALLVSATIVFPAMTSMMISSSHKMVTRMAVVISMLAACLGIFISIGLSTPVGPTIVLMYVAFYVLAKAVQKTKVMALGAVGICLVMLLSGCSSQVPEEGSSFIIYDNTETLNSEIEDALKEEADTSKDLVSVSSSNEVMSTESEIANPEEKDAVKSENQSQLSEENEEKIDLDLSIMNTNMAYAMLINIFEIPDHYSGKTIKIKGLYYPYYDEDNDIYYHIVMIDDTTACCSTAIIFESDEGLNMTLADYPEEGEEIVVEGELLRYEHEGAYVPLIKIVNANIQ